MPNLLKNLKKSFQDTVGDKLLVAFLALVLVVSINHLVFTYLARDNAKAFGVSEGNSLVLNLGNQTVNAGTANVVLAEFTLPDPSYNDSYVCGWRLDNAGAGFDNQCISMVDADGVGTTNMGSDDDNAKYVSDLDYLGDVFFRNSIMFRNIDNICADNLTNPTEVYWDASDFSDDNLQNGSAADCIPGNSAVADIILSDSRGVSGTLNATFFTNVSSGGLMTWAHSEKVQRNQFVANNPPNPQVPGYDFLPFLSNNLYFTDTGACSGANPGLADLEQESFWQDVNNDGVFDPAMDSIFWDYSGCLSTGPCANGGCVGTLAALPGTPLLRPYYDDIICGNSDGDWDPGEAVWLDAPNGTVGLYNSGDGDLPSGYDPASCLSDTFSSGSPLVASEKYTETIWILNNYYFRGDNPLAPGSQFNNGVLNQWQGDSLSNTWGPACGNPNGVCYLDNDSNLVFSGSSTDVVVIDVNGDGLFDGGDTDVYGVTGTVPAGQTLLDLASAYGPTPKQTFVLSGANTVGPVIFGTTFNVINGGDGICTDNLLTPTVVYQDGNGNCISGDAPGDVLLRDDSANGLTTATLAATGWWGYWDDPIEVPAGTPGVYDVGDDLYSWRATSTSVYANYGLFYTDLDGNGAFDPSGNETIIEDSGTTQIGLAGDSGLLDKPFVGAFGFWIPDYISGGAFRNYGTAVAGVDYINVRLYGDVWPLNGGPTDSRCNGGSATGWDDYLIGNLNYDGVNNLWDTTSITWPLSPMPIVPIRVCVVVDIPASAVNSRTIRFGIPALTDTGATSGLYDPGEAGLFFYSQNDGPVGGNALAPNIVTISSSNTGSTGHVKIIPVVPPTEPQPTPQLNLPAGVEVGDLVKSNNSKAVYLVTSDGKRAVFPHAKVYFSYYEDFSRVKVISDQALSELVVGKNMTLRAGTNLMKMESNPNVYAIEPGGVKRLIASADVAAVLFGSNWATKVIDMSDAFWIDYVDGEQLVNGSAYPTGSLIQYADSTDVYYIDKGIKRLVTEAVFDENSFQEQFVIKNVNATAYAYPSGDNLLTFTDFSIALQRSKIIDNLFSASGLKK